MIKTITTIENKKLDYDTNIVKDFIAFLNIKYLVQNLSNINDELNKKLKDKLSKYLENYNYLNNRFSPLRKHVDILYKPTQETANTKLLTLFLKQYEFKNYLLKSLIYLIEDKDKNKDKYKNKDNLTIRDAESEVPIKNGRIDVLCTCNEYIDGKNQIVIEAKIGQREQDKQTVNYYKAKEKTAFEFIYLTKETQMPQCEHFKNITWLDLAAAFYAGYNRYKHNKNKKSFNIHSNIEWKEIKFGELEDTNEGIFFQMWLSHILTHLYEVKDIDSVLKKHNILEENEYRQINQSVSFIEKYEYIMVKIYGKQ